jgi:hypothetical protein
MQRVYQFFLGLTILGCVGLPAPASAVPPPVVEIADPRGDVVGHAAHASTIDVFKVRYKLKPHLAGRPAFSVAVRYHRSLLADVGRQSFVANIRAGGHAFALVARANGYYGSADLYRVTDEGWQETHAAVHYSTSFFSDRGFLQAAVPARIFHADRVDRVQTRLRLRDHGGRAVDRTRPHLTPISLLP